MNYGFYMGFDPMLRARGAQKTAEYAVKMGFSSVEFLETTAEGEPAHIPDLQAAKELRHILEDHGLSVNCYSVGTCLMKAGYVPDEAAVESLKRQTDVAAALGSPFFHHILLPGFRPGPAAPTFETLLGPLTEMALSVAEKTVDNGMTPLYEEQGFYMNGVEHFGTFIREMKSAIPQVGVCGDVGNILYADEDPEAFFKAFAHEIRHVHIKDYFKPDADHIPDDSWATTLHGGRLKACVIGEGCIDQAACLAVLKEVGYTGALSLELEHGGDFDEGVRAAMRTMARCGAE